jgi:hypothetical protein
VKILLANSEPSTRSLLPWRDVGYLVANGVKADVPAEQRIRRTPRRRELKTPLGALRP